MKRRAFITLLAGAAAWPLGSHAQQGERVRRIGVLMGQAATDPEGQSRLAAFLQGLQETGWSVGRNVQQQVITVCGASAGFGIISNQSTMGRSKTAGRPPCT